MTKRLVLFFLVICLSLSLCACKASEIVTLDGIKTPTSEEVPLYSASVFSTRDDQEYLQFLTDFDSQTYEIVDISTGMVTYGYGESYIVTYQKKTDTNVIDTTAYKYYIYKTRSQDEYLSFYSSFDLEKYEILDISTRLTTYGYGESYVITYSEPV